MEICISRFVSHFPLSWVVFVWILPSHDILKYQVIGRNTFWLIKKNPTTLTTLDDWSNSYIGRWVAVHFLLLYVFLHSALLSNSYFFLTWRFCCCGAHIFLILSASFPGRHNSAFGYCWFRSWWNNVIRFITCLTISNKMGVIIFIVVWLWADISFILIFLIQWDFFW